MEKVQVESKNCTYIILTLLQLLLLLLLL